MADFFVAGMILLAIAAVILYMAKEKKKGNSCIGCPYAGSCQDKGKNCSIDIAGGSNEQ